MEVEPEDGYGTGDDQDDPGAERRRLMKGAVLGVALGAFLAVAARLSGRRRRASQAASQGEEGSAD